MPLARALYVVECYVTGFGHSAYVPVEPGDTISAEAMMKFVSGTQGGFIYMAL
jgi:hypothetical protein